MRWYPVHQQGQVAMDRRQLSKRYWDEVWNSKDATRIADYFTNDVVLHVSGAEFPGRENAMTMLEQWFQPFPDLHVEVQLQVEEDPYLSEYVVFSGTHSGAPFHPGLFRSRGLPPIPPTGNAFEFTQTHICRYEGELVAEIWEDFDRIRMFMQLGVTLNVPGTDR